MFAGEPAAAREHSETGRRLYDPERHRSHRMLYGGHDPGVCAGYMGASVHWLLGYPEKGLALGNEALALAECIAHPLSLGFADAPAQSPDLGSAQQSTPLPSWPPFSSCSVSF